MIRRLVLHGLISVAALTYFFVFGGEHSLLDLLIIVVLLNSLLTLVTLAWTRPGSGEMSRHQQILAEEKAWWQARQAARRGRL